MIDETQEVSEEKEYGPEPLFTEDELANLRVIKLSNGEEILACILAIVNGFMLVRRPCKIIRVPNMEGSVAVILLKWQPFSHEEKHTIRYDAIVSYSRVTKDIYKFYVKTVLEQILEENREKNPSSTEFEWPEWMDGKLEKLQIN